MLFVASVQNILRSFLKKWFGPFTKEDLKKYTLLGIIFAFIIGTYWTLRPLKDALFGCIVGKGSYFAIAKIVSMVLLFPLVALYGKLVERYARNRLFYFMGTIYAIMMIAWAIIFALPHIGLSNTVTSPWRIYGWLWYVFVESFGSLMVALFWAFITDISDPHSAKHGFPLIVLIGQIGGIAGPFFLSKIPVILGTSSAPLVAFCSILVLITMGLVALFMHVTPKKQLVGFKGKYTKKKESPGFFAGIKIIGKSKYLLGIFSIIAFFEIIVTFIEFNFQVIVMDTFAGDVARNLFLSSWGWKVNLVTFLCLFFGVNNIQRILGTRFALGLVPLIIGSAVLVFKFHQDIHVLFWLMIGAKAINYSLNGPTIKQLYVPTTKDTKYKAQAWIETFGARGSKAASSGINALRDILGSNIYLAMTIYLSFGLIGLWFLVGLFLGSKYDKAIEEHKTAC